MQKLQRQQGSKGSHGVSVSKTSFYSGKLPSPEMMQQYQEVDPTFANRILKMAESEEDHVHTIERRQLTVSVIMATFGILSGLGALGGLLYLTYLSLEKGNTEVCLGIIAIIATVVAIFVLRKRSESPNK